jgi:hypothetical protein
MAGPEGISSISYPGVRLADSVHKLRKSGINIKTKYEQHGGEFAGSHGIYILKSKVIRLVDQQHVQAVQGLGEVTHA